MSKKVYVDADGKAVAKGSIEAAYIFNEGDVRLDKFRAAVKDREAIAAGRPIARSDAAMAEDDGTVERVSRGKG